MAKGNFVCPTCGYEDVKPGLCPDCSMELEESCPDCGNPKSECICEVNKEEEEEQK
jgi:predicted amidophosphoribosyltransferase